MKRMGIENFIELNRSDMETNLVDIVDDLKDAMSHSPEDYIEHGTDSPSIDVRLCIDLTDNDMSWTFRTGLSDYDQRHTTLCGASSIGPDTSPNALLNELISQVTENI